MDLKNQTAMAQLSSAFEQFSNGCLKYYYAIAMATLVDWSKNIEPVFQPMRSKPKSIAPCKRDCSRDLSKLLIIASYAIPF